MCEWHLPRQLRLKGRGKRKIILCFCSRDLPSVAAKLIHPIVPANSFAGIRASSEAGTIEPACPRGASLSRVKSAVGKSYLGAMQPLRPSNLSICSSYWSCSFWRPHLIHQAPQSPRRLTVLFSYYSSLSLCFQCNLISIPSTLLLQSMQRYIYYIL